MKVRFSNIDVAAAVRELQSLIGLRVTNVYDADHKVYLFKFAKPDSKVVLLIESGLRIHTTDFEWPKNPSPSSFAMKLRKHIRNRRLEMLRQLGVDRIIDMQFGSREAAYHVILELYDRGNIILTDHEYKILNILRARTDQDTDVRFAVHETYPLHLADSWTPPAEDELRGMLLKLPGKEQLKKILNSRLFYGSAVVEHALLTENLTGNQKVSKESNLDELIPKLVGAIRTADKVYKDVTENVAKGVITFKTEKKIENGKEEACQVFQEFHPYRFLQFENGEVLEKPTFVSAVDEFFSRVESQRLDMSIVEQQKQALKKLENVQKDHERRLDVLRKTQEKEQLQARLIEENVDVVERIIVYMRTIMAAELGWSEIAEMLERRRERGDEIADRIVKADIANNTVTIVLERARDNSDGEDNDEDEEGDVVKLDIHLGQSAFQNITRLHTVKKQAAAKEHKTVEASAMALRNAEKKTKQALKDVTTMATITRARKTQWFEKFFWFISSDGYLVIGGRDAQQNEQLVRRYLKPQDFYVHADLHGASSVLVKNVGPSGDGQLPVKALNEAGVMSICYSVAWENKVPCKAWWVYAHQVSKTAPTGEYLSTGSFMIRGRKNYFTDLPMVMGFGILFKIDDDSVKNHVAGAGNEVDDAESVSTEATTGEDVILEMGPDSDDEKEGGPVEEEQAAKEFSDGVNLIRALASRILSTGDDNEENTLIAATTSGVVPKTPQQRNLSNKNVDPKKPVEPAGKGKATKESRDGSANNKTAKPVNQDDDDWSDYKKKKGKNRPRPAKNYDEKHQGLPAKVKKTKPSEIQVAQAAVGRDEGAQENEDDAEVPLESELEVQEDVSDKVVTSAASGKPTDENPVAVDEVDQDEGDEEDAGKATNENVEVLKTFVGHPVLDDTLLFGLPVCAPYSAMQNYKLKIKLLPGTAKRGKAAKACFQMFQKERTLSAMEKDIVKAIKDQDFSRNFPGSVKVAVAQQKFKQHRKK